jgi:hypothetical protein
MGCWTIHRAGRLLSEQAGFPVIVLGVIAVMDARKGLRSRSSRRTGLSCSSASGQFIRSLPPRLSDGEIEAIYDIARRSTTWH